MVPTVHHGDVGNLSTSTYENFFNCCFGDVFSQRQIVKWSRLTKITKAPWSASQSQTPSRRHTGTQFVLTMMNFPPLRFVQSTKAWFPVTLQESRLSVHMHLLSNKAQPCCAVGIQNVSLNSFSGVASTVTLVSVAISLNKTSRINDTTITMTNMDIFEPSRLCLCVCLDSANIIAFINNVKLANICSCCVEDLSFLSVRCHS